MNNAAWNRFVDRSFKYFGILCTLFGLILLAIFVLNIVMDGITRVNWQFLTSLPSRFPAKSGILTAWTGSIWIFTLTGLFAIPLGISASIWLEEYGKKNPLAQFLEINISNLAGVPSIIYGILGLEIFGRIMGLGNSLLAGSFTLALLILPIIIVATREAIRAVPNTIREASYGLGASKWQTIWNQVLPASFSSIMTGIILALARAIGETAPLIVIGALAYVPFVAATPMDEFTVLPIQIFNWASRPQIGFLINAAAGSIVLLCFVFLMNGVAILLRRRAQRNLKW